MISIRSQLLRPLVGTVALGAALIGLCAASTPASARIWFGIGLPPLYVGPPAYYAPPPVYYPPPAYYPPPTAYAPPAAPYAPPASYAPSPAESGQMGQSCYAGAYVCPMDRPVASGTSCYCPGNGGSRVWGHAS